MARTPIRSGDLGTVQITRLARGRYRARSRTCDDAGTPHQIRRRRCHRGIRPPRPKAQGQTAQQQPAGQPHPGSTIAEAATVWLQQIRACAIAGSLSFSTYESYGTAARCLFVPQCGGMTLDALTV
jgi:hypothetical protein